MITLNAFAGLVTLLVVHLSQAEKDKGRVQGSDRSRLAGANVILLTYHRSGSSFVGEALASHDKFAFYFEPLFYPSQMHQNTAAAFEDCLQRLLTCDATTLDQLRKQNVWILRKFGPVWNTFKNESKYTPEKLADICKHTPFKLAKTIRLRLDNAVNMVKRNIIPKLKIVHLVRDPRARYNSAHTPGGRWSDEEKSVESICLDMSKDAKLIGALPKHVYRLLRYEDMVENPTKAIRDIYNDLLGGLKITPSVRLYIKRHTHAEMDKTAVKEMTRYYSTFRNSNFDHNHWKVNLNTSQIQMIQDKCRTVLIAYGYQLMEL